jgi:ligand-binding sensor domain-containing protein
MVRNIRLPLLVVFALFFFRSYSQQIGIGDWRDELPYFEVISVTEDDSKIYAATPYALFYFDKDDNSVQRITKINGLSDIGIRTINYSKEYKTLVIAYENANIDILKDNTFINISDIKRASILGNKTINSIYFIGKYAYLSCGFGIVVMDIDKEEISDTYYIGLNGSQVNVLALTKSDHDTLFAATEKGIYRAYAKSTSLANYESWGKDTRLDTNAYYNTVATFSGNVIVNKHNSVSSKDTMYLYSGNQWSKWNQGPNLTVFKIESTNNFLAVTFNYFVRIYDPSFTQLMQIYTYEPVAGNPYPLDAIVDKDQTVWIGDNYSGLISYSLPTQVFSKVDLSGPLTALVFSLSISGNDLYVAPGGRDNSYVPIPGQQGQIYHYDNSNWWNYGMSQLGNVTNIVTSAIDPSDNKRIYAGSWGQGLVEQYDGEFVARYGESNSTLRHHSASDTSDIRVGGTAFDKEGALWVVTSHTNSCLSRKMGSVWTGYNIPKANENDLAQLMIDSYDQKWIIMRYGNTNTNSVLVFTDNGTPDDPSDDKSRLLNNTSGNGNICGNVVFAMAEDRNGQVWVGTENGICVFYSPENLFVTGANFDAQQILVKQGNYYQYLLEGETVTAIAVDGANQKWIGTDRGGIFLFSPDGTKQLQHFTIDNSPLFSDRITAIAINPLTGEVFIGTDKGILSYKSNATVGGDTFSDVYAYPNPVKEGYTGYIAIKGLVEDAEVKITDISGRLIYSTKATGGQAIWNGQNFSGKRAKTGVYLVLASNTDGSEKIVTKILIIN